MRLSFAALAFGICACCVATPAPAADVDNPYGSADILAMPKASKKHDRVTFKINESTSAKHEATTDTTKETSAKWSFANLFQIAKDRNGDLTVKNFPDAQKPNLDVTSTREHKGEGETESKNTAKTELSGEVVEVMPNSHLIVEARSSITVNNEERVVVFTGRVDPRDLTSDNSIDSKYVIDRTVKFLGKGDIAEAVRRGWFAKAFDFLSPF